MKIDNNELFKAAFVIGAGLYLGKYFCETVGELCEMACKRFIQNKAENGDQRMQNVCREAGIYYESSENDGDETKVKIGFHI